MKTKQVIRYSCDYCGKNGYSASHMSRHERSCTKNPNRVCRVCWMDWEDHPAEQPKMADLLACLPSHPRTYYEAVEPMDGDMWVEHSKKMSDYINAALPKLREAAHNCPACIMAAIRQSNIPVYMASDFNFTKEMKAIWDSINDARMEADARNY